MADYILSSCSTADLTVEKFAELNIPYIAFPYELDGEPKLDIPGDRKAVDSFYRALDNGAESKTSQINSYQYKQYFRELLKEGKDILHVSMSSGLSGSINGARMAAEELKEEYPDRRIVIVDSLAASTGMGLMLDKAAELRDAGYSLDELKDWLKTNRLNLQLWYYSTTVKYFVKGGRISRTAGLLGGILGICPMLSVDKLGHLIPVEKIRTRKKAARRIVEVMKELAEDGENYSGKCYMNHSACMEEARGVAAEIEATFPNLKGKVEIYDIGTVVGSHCGPGTVAVYFWGKERELESKEA